MCLQQLNLEFPEYTRRPAETVEALTLTVPEGTKIIWKLALDRVVDEAESYLAEMQTDYLDALTFYYLENEHEWQTILAKNGAMALLEKLKTTGTVRAIGAIRHRVPTPSVISRLGKPGRGSLNAWLTALDRRQGLLPSGEETTFRIIHSDGEGVKCDLLGEVCWFYWFRQRPPDDDDLVSYMFLVLGQKW